MIIIDFIIKYWVIWSSIVGSISGLVYWNYKIDKRLNKVENTCAVAKEITDKREAAVDKAIETLFDLMNELIPLVHEIKGILRGSKK